MRQRDIQHNRVDVEPALAVVRLGWGVAISPEGEIQIEDGVDVRKEPVLALPSESPMAALQFEDRVLRIGIEVVAARNAGLRRPIAVIVLVVKPGHATLIVRWNHACAEHSGPVDERARASGPETVVNQPHRIGLAQVLIGGEYTRAGWLDGSKIRQDRRVIRKHRLEPEPVGQISLALGDIVVEGDMNVICDAVVEAKSIRTDARLLERKNRKSGGQKLLTKGILADESIHVGRVGCWIKCYERRVHVA